jgi:hypothetical protein
MARLNLLGAAIIGVCLFPACSADHRVGDNSLTVSNNGAGDNPGVQPASVVIDVDGTTFQSACANGSSGMQFMGGSTCGAAGHGSGPEFDTAACSIAQTPLPRYSVAALFRNFDSSIGIADGTTFDLSDPGHEQHLTVMFDNEDSGGNVYRYCSAGPVELTDGVSYPASSGTVTVHHFVPYFDGLNTLYNSDVELSNVVVPPTDGGPTVKVVSAHLYFP